MERSRIITRACFFLQGTSLVSYVLRGIIAFLIFESCLAALLNILGLSRARGFLFQEFLLFTSVSGLIYSYSRFNQPKARRPSVLHNSAQLQDPPNCINLAGKLDSLSDGILESLSAIMFFARAHLVGASPQKARDLREIAERIDQVQLLLREMRASLNRDFDKEQSLGMIFPPDSSVLTSNSVHPIETPESLDYQRNGKGWVKQVSSLRKSAREVLILPVTVRFLQNENNLEFETYTANVCEEGACIILSSNFLSQGDVIDVQMSPEFVAQARLRWVQPFGRNSFGLGGIEFLGNKFQMSRS
jgi:hypothetical protein